MGPGSGYPGLPKSETKPEYVQVTKIYSKSEFVCTPIRVQPGPYYPGSSGSSPNPGYFTIPIEMHRLSLSN